MKGIKQQGDVQSLSRDESRILHEQILPTCERWMEIPGLRQHAKNTLAYWGVLEAGK